MTLTPDDAPRGLPATITVTHVAAQLAVLAAIGVATLVASLESPVLAALLADLDPIVDPWPEFLPLRILAPLLLPVLLGIPVALLPYRAPVLLFMAAMAIVATLAVVEAARLNWAAFFAGIAFRAPDPVPLVRSIAGLAIIMGSVLLLGEQSVHQHVKVLAARGLAAAELRLARRRLVARERGHVLLALLGGIILLLVARFSMLLTERPPGEAGALFPILLWALALVALLAGVLAYRARRRAGG